MLTEILDQIAEMSIPEALMMVRKAVPDNNDLRMLKAQVNTLEYDFHSGTITQEVYQIGIVKKRKALVFFLGRMKEGDLAKIYSLFFGIENTSPSVISGVQSKTEILFMAATPVDADRLQINVEYDKIKDAINASLFRDNWALFPIMSVTINSMVTTLSGKKPAIVHFSGHSGTNGIVLSNESNKYEVVKTEVLKSIFSQFKTQCIFLNGCYSAAVAKELSQFSNYVIGMNAPFGDNTAIIFSSSFYGLLCNSKESDYLTSFTLAKSILMVKEENESNIPEIWQNGEKITLL